MKWKFGNMDQISFENINGILILETKQPIKLPNRSQETKKPNTKKPRNQQPRTQDLFYFQVRESPAPHQRPDSHPCTRLKICENIVIDRAWNQVETTIRVAIDAAGLAKNVLLKGTVGRNN